MIMVYPNSYFLPVVRETEDQGLFLYRGHEPEIPKSMEVFNYSDEIHNDSYESAFKEIDEEFIGEFTTN